MLKTANLFEKKPNKVFDHHKDTILLQKTNSIMIKKVFKETLGNFGNLFLEQEP